MKNIFRTLVLVSSSAALFVGCSSASGDGSDSDSDIRIKPTGNEKWANLTVQLPTGTCQPGGSCTKPLGATAAITVDGISVALAAKTRLKPGDHSIQVNGTSMKVTLSPGQNKTVTLAVAKRKCDPAPLPSVAQTDFGRTVSIANAACPNTARLPNQLGDLVDLDLGYWNCGGLGNPSYTLTLGPQTTANDCASHAGKVACSFRSKYSGSCQNSRQYPNRCEDARSLCDAYVRGDYSWVGGTSVVGNFADQERAYVPGAYELDVNGATQSFTLRDGDVKDITVSLPVIGTIPSTFKTNLKFTEARELTDARATTITSNCSGERTYTVPQNASGTVALKAFENSSCKYTVNVGGGRTVELDQAQVNNVSLARLDIDDVEITREDGTTYTTRGTYELYFGGALVGGPFNTNSGVDVLPGTYELVTKYSTADGPQVERQQVQF